MRNVMGPFFIMLTGLMLELSRVQKHGFKIKEEYINIAQ